MRGAEKHYETITLKEEELIQQILDQQLQMAISGHPEFDKELEQLLLNDIESESLSSAHQGKEWAINHIGINFDELAQKQWDQRQAQPLKEEQEILKKRNEDDTDIADTKKLEQQPKATTQTPPIEEYILSQFERQHLNPTKPSESQLLQLDHKFPKINHMQMFRHHYPIFSFTPLTSVNYLKYKKVALSQVSLARIVKLADGQVWELYVLKNQLMVFRSTQQDPLVFTHDDHITHLEVSQCSCFVALAMSSTIIIYEVRKSTSLVLYKSLSQLKIASIEFLSFYGVNPLRLYFLDGNSKIGLITIDHALIFTKISINEVEHSIESVDSCPLVRIGQNCSLMAIVGTDRVELFGIEPNVQLLFEILLQEGAVDETQDKRMYVQNGKQKSAGDHQGRNNPGVLAQWRSSPTFTKSQLLISHHLSIRIYKLLAVESDPTLFYLQLYLTYPMHYPVLQMHVLSDYHLLLQAKEHIVVVAVPLIPFSDSESMPIEGDDLAIVYITPEGEYKIFEAHQGLVLFSIIQPSKPVGGDESNDERIESARKSSETVSSIKQGSVVASATPVSILLGTLQLLSNYLDQLITKQSNFRQAFTLLILVYKGVNYSFNFSYSSCDFLRLLNSTISCFMCSILPILDTNIVLFRVSWICQLCLQCQQPNLIWTMVYPRLKQINQLECLYEVCEIFILRSQLTAIPQQIFFDMVNFFVQKGKQGILEALIITSCGNYDGSKLMSILSSSGLYYLQCYLFSTGLLSEECDFYSPLLRMYSALCQATEKKDLEKTQRIGMTCLWYLHKCFGFTAIPSGVMDRERKVKVVLQLFMLGLSKSILKRLADFHLVLLLETYLVAFINEEFRQILEEEDKNIRNKHGHDYAIDSNKELIDSLLAYIADTIGSKRNAKLWSEFQALVLYFSHVKTSFEQVTDLLILLFEHKFSTVSLHLPSKVSNPTSFAIKRYFLSQIEQQLSTRQDRLCIRKLISFEDPELNYLLHAIDKNYHFALEQYPPHLEHQLIPFIYQLLTCAKEMPQKANNFLRERKILELRNYVCKNIAKLFLLCKQAALDLCYDLGQTTASLHHLFETESSVPDANSQGESSLSSFHISKLNFITAVLNKFTGQDFEQKSTYLQENLQTVCLLPEKTMLDYLNRYYYPLDMAIGICEQKGNYLAKAIFQERSGMLEAAFRSYERLLKETVAAKEAQTVTREKVQTYIHQCLRISKQSSQLTTWIKTVKLIRNFILSPHQCKISLKIEMERLLELVISEMLLCIPTQALVEMFTQARLEVGWTREKTIYELLFRMAHFDRWTLKLAMHSLKADLKQLRQLIDSTNRMAIQSQIVCSFCRSPLLEEVSGYIFPCLHSFHKICHDDFTYCLTCYYQSDDALFDRFAFRALHSLDKKSEQQMFAKSQPRKQSAANYDIYVQSAEKAREESCKKKLKLFDYDLQRIEKQAEAAGQEDQGQTIKTSNPLCPQPKIQSCKQS